MFTIPHLPMKVTIILPILVITISLLLLVQPGALQLVWSQQGNDTTTITTDATNGINRGVYPPDSAPYDLTYGEWSALWWQWVLSLPEDINPLIDQTGEHCAQGQDGPVWFLAGTVGGPVERTCTIPEGKAILFPVYNSGNVRTDPSETEEDLRVTTKDSADRAAVLEASIDGVPLQDLQNYRAESPLFNVTLPEGNIFGVPEMSSEAVAEGYWVMLEPLPVGDHSLHFRGAAVDAATGGLVTEATYQLTIEPAATTTPIDNVTDTTTVAAETACDPFWVPDENVTTPDIAAPPPVGEEPTVPELGQETVPGTVENQTLLTLEELTLQEVRMHIEEGCIAIHNNDTQGALLNLNLAVSTIDAQLGVNVTAPLPEEEVLVTPPEEEELISPPINAEEPLFIPEEQPPATEEEEERGFFEGLFG